MRDRPTKPVIVWLDYGQDGWGFAQFDTDAEALVWAQTENCMPWVITRLLSIAVVPRPAKEGERE